MGSFGSLGSKVIFNKNAITCPCYIAWSYEHIHSLQTLYHICRINRQPGVSQGSKSQSRQGTSSVMATCLVFSFFLLLATRLFHILPNIWFWPNLVTVQYLNHYSRTNNDGVRGHDGVTGVKKVIFTKKASSPTEYVALMHDSWICISLTPSTKVITLKGNDILLLFAIIFLWLNLENHLHSQNVLIESEYKIIIF